MAMTARQGNLVIEKNDGTGHDWGLIFSALALIAVGIFSNFSIDVDRGTNFATRQLVFSAIGVIVFFICNKVKLEFVKIIAPALYVLNVLLLVATIFVGKSRGITSRWIEIGPMQFQPSEVTKLILAVTLAAYFAKREERMNELSTYLGALLHAAPILCLVLLQPHLGATLALLFLTLIACTYAGVPGKFFPATLVAIAAIGGAAWFTPGLMPDYMRARVDQKVQELVYGERDPRGAGYQQHQAMLAIGSGGTTGTGFFRGEQKATGVIPEQQTDFIFSVVGEEGGFFGSVLVIGLFSVFFYFVWRRAFLAQSMMGKVVAGSLFAVLAFHAIVNLAMLLSFGPVVGLWLPFMSHGGTALWMCMGAVGLLDQCD